MKESVFRTFLLLLLTVFFAGCAGMKAKAPTMAFTPHTFEAGEYTPKVDNFQFILDASYSMDRNCRKNFRIAKDLITAINQSLPTELGFTGGLRTFGHDSRQSTKLTELAYGMTKYTRTGLQNGLESVNYAGGNSPLPEAIEAAGADLKKAPGKSAIVIVSDGQKRLQMDGAPAAAGKLKDERGDNLCIYTIAVGGDPAGEKFLQEVAQAAGCGSSTTAAALADPGALASFVEKVFLKKPAMMAKAPMDSDGDGVIDSRDKCPGTPKGQQVDEDGCPLKLTLHINFDFDKAEIKPEFEPDLKKAAEFIQKNQKVPYILIEGYTDSKGDDAYNQDLSERRAQAVKQALVDMYGIDADRLVAKGGGESNPVASNDTEEGRYQNRRVEIICCVVQPER